MKHEPTIIDDVPRCSRHCPLLGTMRDAHECQPSYLHVEPSVRDGRPGSLCEPAILARLAKLEAVRSAAERDFRARDYHYTVAKALQALKEDR